MAVHVLPPPGTRREGTATGCPSTHKSRRDVLGGAGFTALAGIAAVAIARPDASLTPPPPALHPDDAELIAIGQEVVDLLEQRRPLEARWWALPTIVLPRTASLPGADKPDAVAAAMEPIDNRLEYLSDRVLELRATTHDAWIAKVRLIRHEIAISNVSGGEMEFEGMPLSERITWSLLDDLLAVQS